MIKIERRKFISSACILCLGMFSGTAPALFLSGCATINAIDANLINGKLIIPLSAIGRNNYVIVRASGYQREIALIKRSDGSYTALAMECTHYSKPLDFDGKFFFCNAHGSRFTTDGEVIQGPARRQLKQFSVSHDESVLQITLNK